MTFHQYWIQIRDLTLASIKSRYRKTWAGFLWVVLNPILQFGVQSLVFKQFLRLEINNYYLFLLGGLLPWIFFTSTLSMGTPTFVSQATLLRSFKISPMVILSSQILDNFLNFIASLVIILLPFYFLSDKSTWALVFVPLAIVPLLIGTASITIALSVLNVFYRDINFVIGFVLSLLFFLTPIFYPREFVPEHFQWMITVNPIVYFIEPFRLLLNSDTLDLFFYQLGQGFLVSLGFAVLALIVWRRNQNAFYRKL